MITSAQPLDYEYQCGTAESAANGGDGPESTICTAPGSVRFVRVAVHFLLRGENIAETVTHNCSTPTYTLPYVGPGNFTETHDGVTAQWELCTQAVFNDGVHTKNLIKI